MYKRQRELQTSVVAGNDEIIVLGGLIDEKQNRSESKIPGFGDLPLIGWMFGSKTNTVTKTNLLLFIRPTIIRSQEDLIRVTTRARSRYEALKTEKNVTEKVLKDLDLPTPQGIDESVQEGIPEPVD